MNKYFKGSRYREAVIESLVHSFVWEHSLKKSALETKTQISEKTVSKYNIQIRDKIFEHLQECRDYLEQKNNYLMGEHLDAFRRLWLKQSNDKDAQELIKAFLHDDGSYEVVIPRSEFYAEPHGYSEHFTFKHFYYFRDVLLKTPQGQKFFKQARHEKYSKLVNLNYGRKIKKYRGLEKKQKAQLLAEVELRAYAQMIVTYWYYQVTFSNAMNGFINDVELANTMKLKKDEYFSLAFYVIAKTEESLCDMNFKDFTQEKRAYAKSFSITEDTCLGEVANSKIKSTILWMLERHPLGRD